MGVRSAAVHYSAGVDVGRGANGNRASLDSQYGEEPYLAEGREGGREAGRREEGGGGMSYQNIRRTVASLLC